MGVQVPSPAPVKNLLELLCVLGLKININSIKGLIFLLLHKKKVRRFLNGYYNQRRN